MSATQPILDDLKNHLAQALPDWDVELFPNQPETYHLSHIYGAVLISYLASKFEKPRATQAVTQTRHVQIALTVLTRDLHDDVGALDLLDRLRLLVVGFRPANCNPCWLVDEFFNGSDEETGIWQYQLIVQCETQQIEQQAVANLPKFTTAHLRRADQPVRPDLKLKP